jgi:subtilisin
MKTKRYLILPQDGIRLSDAVGVASLAAASLLNNLQPAKKAAVRSLGAKLLAATRSASPTASAAAGKKGKTKATRAEKASAKAKATDEVLRVVESLGEDSVKLVEASEAVITALRQQHPGVRVIEEKFCKPALAPRRIVPPRPVVPALARAAAQPLAGTSFTVEVLRGDNGAPVRGAEVIAFRTAADALQKKTNAAGKATFSFGAVTAQLSKLYVYHEEPGVWGFFKKNVVVSNGAVQVQLAALDLAQEDGLRFFHGTGALEAGAGVRVGVIDSGADPDHPDLTIEGGANCVPQSTRAADDFGPDGAHGTHVAGTIAARGTAPDGVRGVAPGVKLRIYRVFEKGNPGNGSSFAVIDAIERAIADECDIINLSLGFDPGVTDDGISDVLRKARKRGILAIAAAGNDRRQPVSFPASDSSCVAISATGRKGFFPKTATEVDDIAAPFGSDTDNFVATFSNFGTDLDGTGSGVGIVSTFPGGYGAMSGTSMASPAVAGVAARLLAQHPAVFNLPRTAARTDAIKQLLVDAAESLGLGILFEGMGLPK